MENLPTDIRIAVMTLDKLYGDYATATASGNHSEINITRGAIVEAAKWLVATLPVKE